MSNEIRISVAVNPDHIISLIKYKDPEEMEKFICDLADRLFYEHFKQVFIDKITKIVIE